MNALAFTNLLAFGLMDFAGAALKGLIVIFTVLQIVPGCVYLERKICAYIQGRRGPNRVGPFGLLQPVADAVKLLFKEEIVPKDADRVLYYLGPFFTYLFPFAALAFVPFGPTLDTGSGSGAIDFRVCSVSTGILLLFAVSSLGVYGIAFGGWASNSKYSLMGAVRGSSQMISYEIGMGLALLATIATVGSVDLQQCVVEQTKPLSLFGLEVSRLPNWLIFHQPLAALIFLVCAFAENNRTPFDLPEAEPELGAGYHTEYTGLKFAMFMMGEYVAMIAMSSVFVTLYFGGWSIPFVSVPNGVTNSWIIALLATGVFLAKVMAVLIFYMWVRWTLPRFRYDQLMRLGWKMLVPLGIANLFLTGVSLAL
jgi:NADH-quinone oxidoreductase subunit H